MRKPNTRYLVLAILLCAATAFLLVSLRGGRRRTQSRVAPRQIASATLSADVTDLPPAAPADADYGRYQMIVDRDVFSRPRPAPLVAQSPAPRGSLPPLSPSPPESKPDKPARPPAAAGALEGWSYLGYVEIDGTLMGLVRNDGDRSSEFVKTGDEFRGATVAEVTLDQIRLKSGARETTLARIDSYSLVPLDKAASTATPAVGPQRR